MDHPPPRPSALSAGGSSSGLSNRAERFEDEKRRIIESCFAKKDPVDNSLLETYITHIRILEFSTHPTSPPPPETRTPQTEKPRVIIVAVRKSGRVRMHKSKENANGTFSIGKTWDLNDMTGIESFTDAAKCDPQARSYAGDVGFIVNLGKPYYWQAQTDKEKKFFIASLIKIYGKYTGGGVPELRGFDPKEKAQDDGQASETAADEERPGLGPMIKAKMSKSDIAGSMWKAASAVSAFKPRAGGAAERLRKAAELAKASETEPDGITGVVPAPARAVATPEPVRPETPKEQSTPKRSSNLVPEVKITVPNASRPSSIQAVPKETTQVGTLEVQTKEDRNRRVAAGNDAKYFTALGVDTSLLADGSSEFAKWLDHFGWIPGDRMRNRSFDDMKLDIDREIGKAQAGGWVARFEQDDDRVDVIKTGLDVAIAECEELDNLLTLYSVELSTLSDDIAYIEAQGQGLQVQASNQKLLRKELESLLDTCAITSDDLRALVAAPLDTTAGLEDIEQALVTLYKAMMKIDPSLTGSDPRKNDDVSNPDQPAGLGTDYGKMRIVQEKKQMYISESSQFLSKFEPFMGRQFDRASQEIKSAIEGSLTKKGDPRRHDVGREHLWKYSPLVLYAREMDLQGWNRMLQVYQEKNFPLYRSECKDLVDSWKRNIKKPTGDDTELLFTAQVEKQHESTMATARKLTVKRSQTLAKSLRSPLGDSDRKKDKGGDNRSAPYEVFAGIVDDVLPLVEIEQNFIVDFFHATTLETADFPDLVAAVKPRDRRGGDLKRHRLMEPDRDLGRRVTRAMEVIFSFLEQDLQTTVAWVLSQHALQGVGVLVVLERKQTEMVQTNQDYLNNILQKLQSGLESQFNKFVEEQIRAIEETKVKIKKRKGVIAFMRVFPNFSAAIENMLVTADTHSGVRRMVDKEYDRIIKSMFDSLKFIARENPATLTNSGADPEDKEALNFHILLIENMNHFLDEVDTRGLEILEEWKEAANNELSEHMSLYLNAVMRRPLGKLLEFLENIEAQLASGKSTGIIAALPSNSKATFDKVLSNYDGKEVRKGIEALRKRVDKHFSDDEHEGGGGGGGLTAMPGSTSTLSTVTSVSTKSGGAGGGVLVQRVLRECEKFYGDVEMRISNVTTTVYGGDVLFEWPRQEVKAAFAAK
ncbi:exocyst complex component Sec3-domain-containing protein [Microdochium bolleyi]|uniref:Exocyst complex component Sec3-domain-containing protein n=1 Tax=Microdochium bolleyi TaxID=196109 RepID=A0A136JJK9_9PEZI|nr:exocyst complex component Sec3-domain-containing protein [Microdochium bolleyi]